MLIVVKKTLNYDVFAGYVLVLHASLKLMGLKKNYFWQENFPLKNNKQQQLTNNNNNTNLTENPPVLSSKVCIIA